MNPFCRIKFIFLMFVLFCTASNAQDSKNLHNIPFSTDSNFITIWNGSSYVPFAIKGVNFGISKPGTFPGELLVTREEYGRWFSMIRDAGFNTIRLYTLHFPEFYDVLDSFNLANPRSPLFFFQGIWLEEEVPGYTNDLYFLT